VIKRSRYLNQIVDFIDKPIVKVLTGMRRSGKSALLELARQELLDRGIAASNIILLNFESLLYEHLKNYRSLYSEVSAITKSVEGRVYILLDEIQEVDGWEKAVNSFRVDFDCDIIITGSNARMLSGELATLLAGRYVEIHVYPLSFHEFLAFASENPQQANHLVDENLSYYLRLGGLPGIHQLKWEQSRILQYLTDIYNSVLLKDVISRNKIRDVPLLENIIRYVMDNIGNLFSAKSVSDFLKNQGRKLSTETVYNYLRALEDALLIYKVGRFDIKGKRFLETGEKYFLSDLGLRHAVIGYRDNDISGILENIVYLELRRRGYVVSVGKQGAYEVDFVAERADERVYIQVTYTLTEDNTEREFAPLEAINDNYEKLVVTTDTLISANRNGIRSVNFTDFLLADD